MTKKKYIPGQRWYSEAEPELGLGIITQTENKTLQVFFETPQETRSYGVLTAPLKRFQLEINENIEYDEDQTALITDIKEEDGLIVYISEGIEIPESRIKAQININGPIERFFVQNFDSKQFFNLRYNAYLNYRNFEAFEYKGYLGAKISYLPHQIFVTNQILKMEKPKAMLCDEVGLGKTIEASLILHSLIQRDLVHNALIIVPDSLKNQWFIELYKKFSLSFNILNSLDDIDEEEIDLTKAQRFILGRSEIEQHSGHIENILNIKWDMLIIDESHQIKFSDPDNSETKIIKQINESTLGTLFLSATPEVTGEENLFYQLNTLDPIRYNDYQEFSQSKNKQKEISILIKKFMNKEIDKNALSHLISASEMNKNEEDIIQIIVDRHGIGRSFYRNSRSHLEKFEKIFTKRIARPLPINFEGKMDDKKALKLKTEHVFETIQSKQNQKFFIICHSKEMVLSLQKQLLKLANYKIALFHSDQSLLERDRQAAYFADPEGAQLLICTEIGSEGRNFEFANNLILLDLPKLPDQLEQRIGRLDRIGQKNDINIYVPYLKGTFEEILYRWYDEVLNSFNEYPKGAHQFYQLHKEEIIKLITSSFNQEDLDSKINDLKDSFSQYKKEFEASRDLLNEIKSFQPKEAKKIIDEIKTFENQKPILPFLDAVFNEIGIELSELNDHTYFIKPSHNMLIPSYPGLLADGLSITFDRDYSIKHENIDLLTWEHPIVKNAFDIVMFSPLGNTSIVQTQDLPRDIYFEFIFKLQCKDQYKYKSGNFLPFTPVRILLNLNQDDLTLKLPKKLIDSKELVAISEDKAQILKSFPKESILDISKKAQSLANNKKEKYIHKATQTASEYYNDEVQRLNSLISDSSELEIQVNQVTEFSKKIKESIINAEFELDSFRVILPNE